VNLNSFPQFSSKKNFLLLNRFCSLTLLILLIISCSSTKRFTTETENFENTESTFIRVLLFDQTAALKLTVDDEIFISDDYKKLAKVNSGNIISFTYSDDGLQSRISDKIFYSDTFHIDGLSEDRIIKVNGKKYRGRLKIFPINSKIILLNQISLEDYVKGVITKEMPLGKGDENYNALKAFSICARTYAYTKLNLNKNYFDIYPDVRDQVYGGVDGESEYSNKIVDETRGMILTYDDRPATIFYSSTCGGFTEDVKNVFTNSDLPYLKSVKDGNEPYCSISPRYTWEEVYSEELFISRLYDSKLITNKNYMIKSVSIKSRFESGRVNELEITLTDKNNIDKKVKLVGNSMRSIIKTADGKSILRSTLFDIVLTENETIKISGKGNGHGVGLCQWGAIGQSRKGTDFDEILNHYFPGTKIKVFYD
jgi:stage II sporulation protein D